MRIKRCYVLTAALALSSLLTAITIFAAPGDLDLTFSGAGKLTDFIPGAAYNSFAATAVQPDGKIIAVGGVYEPRYLYAARYNTDGSPDTAFGGGTGKARFQFGGFYNYVSDVALQPDGKIVIAGCYCEEDAGDYNLALARLNSDGSLDDSFGFHGVVTRPDLVGPANSVAIQTDGKIVVAGQAGFYLDWLVLRFNSNGSQDSTFRVSGNVFAPNHAAANSVAIQSDGKIVVAGGSQYFGLSGDFAIVRYNADGSLDATFDGDGIVTTKLSLSNDAARSVAIQSDGKIVAAGYADARLAIVRYLPNGSLDTTFGGYGVAERTPYGWASDIAIRSDGKIVAAGTRDDGLNADFILFRFNPDGSLDTTFGGGDGETSADFGNSDDYASGMALDSAGRAVVVGSSDGRFAIARFLLDPQVSVSGRVTTPGGQGLRNAAVKLTDQFGVGRTTTTSSFGFYSFANIPPGGNVTISVASQLYRFTPRTITVNDNLTDIDFMGLE